MNIEFPRGSGSIGRAFARAWIAGLLATGLAACGGGGGDSAPPVGNNPPPPPAPVDDTPRQSATAIDLNDNHQVGVDNWPNGNTATGGQGATVNGIQCLVNMPETYHVHTHVSIFLNGVAQAVPGNIGIVRSVDPDCFYTIHTHDKSGKIHVESDAPGLFTLGQLFAVWGQPLTNTNLAGYTGLPITIYSTDAGVVTEVESNWDAIELRSHREITIVIGTPITEIPNFTWSSM